MISFISDSKQRRKNDAEMDQTLELISRNFQIFAHVLDHKLFGDRKN